MVNRTRKGIAVWLVIALVIGGIIGYQVGLTPTPTEKAIEGKTILKQDMRKLWADHVFWTRQYIVAVAAGSPDAPEAAGRLLKNQEDIGNAIVPYYGREAGNRLTELLKQHILIAVDLLGAAKSGNQTKFNQANQTWYANAAEIATFLSQANPNWPKAALNDMLNEHLSLTTEEAVARFNNKWAEDVSAFEKVYNQAMKMADALSDGIIKQFPNKF